MMGEWQPIETAPKSTTRPTRYGNEVQGEYFLAYCPDMKSPHTNPKAAMCVCWWEPHMDDGKGRWQGEGDFPLHPTHWMPLPEPPMRVGGGMAGGVL